MLHGFWCDGSEDQLRYPSLSFTEGMKNLSKRRKLEAAMANKRNPMRCERVCGLDQHLTNLSKDCSDTLAAQWFEKSLDDSAIRRIDIHHLFLCADAIVMTLDNVFSGLVAYLARIHTQVMEKLPFVATENIIMKLVTKVEVVRRLTRKSEFRVTTLAISCRRRER